MSNEFTKEKRSTRIHDEETKVKKQVKIAKAHGLTNKDKAIKQAHRLSKHHAMDCGQPGCMLCGNPRKLFKEKTIQEKSFYQNKLYDESEPNMPE
jgi:hypothetical protein